jgi:hypothetical protein
MFDRDVQYSVEIHAFDDLVSKEIVGSNGKK